MKKRKLHFCVVAAEASQPPPRPASANKARLPFFTPTKGRAKTTEKLNDRDERGKTPTFALTKIIYTQWCIFNFLFDNFRLRKISIFYSTTQNCWSCELNIVNWYAGTFWKFWTNLANLYRCATATSSLWSENFSCKVFQGFHVETFTRASFPHTHQSWLDFSELEEATFTICSFRTLIRCTSTIPLKLKLGSYWTFYAPNGEILRY